MYTTGSLDGWAGASSVELAFTQAAICKAKQEGPKSNKAKAAAVRGFDNNKRSGNVKASNALASLQICIEF